MISPVHCIYIYIHYQMCQSNDYVYGLITGLFAWMSDCIASDLFHCTQGAFYCILLLRISLLGLLCFICHWYYRVDCVEFYAYAYSIQCIMGTVFKLTAMRHVKWSSMLQALHRNVTVSIETSIIVEQCWSTECSVKSKAPLISLLLAFCNDAGYWPFVIRHGMVKISMPLPVY